MKFRSPDEEQMYRAREEEGRDLRSSSGYLQGCPGLFCIGSKLGVQLQVQTEALQPLSPVPSFQVRKQLSAWVRTIKELPKNCSRTTFNSYNPALEIVLLSHFTDGEVVTGPRPQVRSLAGSEYEPGSLQLQSQDIPSFPLLKLLPLTGWRCK